MDGDVREGIEGRETVVLGEKVDCIHAILAVWSFKDIDIHGNWVTQAIELTELGKEFARIWEDVTGVKVGVFGAVEEVLSPAKQSFGASVGDGSVESDEGGSPLKKDDSATLVGDGSMQSHQSDEELSPVKLEDVVASLGADGKAESEQGLSPEKDVFTSLMADESAGESESDESMEYIAPLPILAKSPSEKSERLSIGNVSPNRSPNGMFSIHPSSSRNLSIVSPDNRKLTIQQSRHPATFEIIVLSQVVQAQVTLKDLTTSPLPS